MHPSRSTVALALVLLALPGTVARAQTFAPPGWDAAVKLNELTDSNPDPNVVEIELTATLADVRIAGITVKAWTYNGSVPGPLIRTKAGDRLIVHFKNELSEATTVHWHGVRVPIEMDGVPGISQPPVTQGQTFTYDFVVKDAGLFWYHPHVMSAAAVGNGLYGALLVEDPADGVGITDQLTIVLSDIGFDDKGVLEPGDSGGAAGTVFGREGAYVLANGRRNPRLMARSGAPQRWRIVNAAKSRFFQLDLEGQEFTVIGTDGGFQERPVQTPSLLVTPGERVDVIVSPTGEPGSELAVKSMLYNRGYGSVEYRSVETLMTIAFSNDPGIARHKTPAIGRAIVPPQAEGATRVDFTLTLPPVDAKGHNEFRVNGVPFWKAKPYRAALDETQLWVVKNDTEWDHPFHLHGFFFMPLDGQDRPLRPLAWKDTVNVPMKSTVRLLVRFDERPGTWMFHCHILDHADGGLMGTVHVGPGEPVAHTHHGAP